VYYYGGQIEEYEMGGACSAHWRHKYAYKILVSELQKKRPLGRSKHRWEDNIKMVFWGNMKGRR
jgi:hypothetical protein